MELELRSNYWSDDRDKKSFIRYIKNIFKLDFSLWNESGYWDDDYRPFSYFQDGEIVANTCIYSMPAIINGRKTKIAQVSAVGTLPEHRMHGLGKKLSDLTLEYALKEHEFVMLFSSKEALPFYKKMGFKNIPDYAHKALPLAMSPKKGLIKIDLKKSDELRKLFSISKSREAISNIFGNLNPKLLMFHALYTITDFCYYIPQLETYVFMKREDQQLTLFDIVSKKLPAFDDLFPFLTDGKETQILFRFYPDKFSLKTEILELQGNRAHVLGSQFNLEPFTIPYTSMA